MTISTACLICLTNALIDEANRNGGKDNIAIVLVEPQISEVNV